MHLPLRKQHIPWLMAATRAALGPLVILGEACQWSGAALASFILTALLSDIFDGVLARRWLCDTPAVRLFDSMADTVFYLCTAAALWLRYPHLWRTHAALFIALFTLEATRFVYDLTKFGKPASYHSYLAKAWGLILATAVIAAFLTPHADALITAALLLGILCDLEGLTMSLLLPTWHRDVKTLRHAWRLRTQSTTPTRPTQRAYLTAATLLLITLFAAPAFAADTIPALDDNGSSGVIPAATTGTLDLSSPTDLIFRAPTGASISIPYQSILTFNYRVESTHHLGVIPAILVALVNSRMHRHLFTINYTDAAGAKQVAIFDVPKDEPRILLPLLRLRTSVCAPKSYNCGGTLETGPFD